MKLKITANCFSKPIVSLISLLIIILTITACGRFEVDTTIEPLSQTVETATVTPVLASPTPTTEATATTAPTATLLATIATQTPTLASNVMLDATFYDSYVGLAMDYPADWEVVELNDEQKMQSTTYATTFQSWISGPGGGSGIPEGGSKVDLVFSPDGTLTLDTALKERRAMYQSAASETKLLSETPVTLASGLKGVIMLTESDFGQGEQFVSVVNGHLIIFAGLGDKTYLEPMLQSLRASEGAQVAFEPYPVRATEVQAIQIATGSDTAFIYSGPGETFPRITALQSGLALAVSGISPDGKWYELAGCGPQNPFRPAPSCWISADQNVTQPTRSIEPSQQPVLETEKQAVLVTAQNLAPVHGGPDESYPVISQLAGGFSFKLAGVSEDGNWWRLTDCSSPLNEPLSECWVSAAPDVTQALDELISHGPQSSALSTENSPLLAGTTTITDLPRCFNLDNGAVGSEANPNCEFTLYPAESAGTLMFEPVPPARFGFSGVFPTAPTLAMCSRSEHLQGNTEIIAPAATMYVCYQTGEGHFGYLHFLQMTDEPPAVTLEWQTFAE